MDRIYIEGNNGANYVEIIKLDENRLRLKVGDCCVNTIDTTFTAEVLSNFLTMLECESNKSLLVIAKSKLHWSEETNKLFLKNCKNNFP